MIKILGILDIISAILLVLVIFHISLNQKLVLFFAFYLIIKALVFLLSSHDLASIIDLAGGTLLILSLFFILPITLLLIVAVLLLQKGIFSLL